MCRLCSLHKVNQNQRRTDFLSNVLGKDEAMCMEISSVASLPMEPCQFSSEVNGKQHFFSNTAVADAIQGEANSVDSD